MRAPVLVSLLLVASIFAVYGQVASHDFVNYDDYIYVVENPKLPGGLDLEKVVRAFTEPYESNWIPLTWLSLQIDYGFFELRPAGYLLENVVLQVATSVWPTGRAVFYPHLGAALSPGRALAAATLLIAISAASRFRARHYARHCHDPA